MTSRVQTRPSPAPPPRLSPAAAEAAARSTVVVVDDEPANVLLLERLLETVGIVRVHGFTDPGRALAFCAASPPDLVLLDLHMPQLDGFAVMEALRLLVPGDRFLPILVLTADVTPEVRERSLAAGAKDFLSKPFDRNEVLLRVSNLLETRALADRLERHNVELRTELDAADGRRAGGRRRAGAAPRAHRAGVVARRAHHGLPADRRPGQRRGRGRRGARAVRRRAPAAARRVVRRGRRHRPRRRAGARGDRRRARRAPPAAGRRLPGRQRVAGNGGRPGARGAPRGRVPPSAW